MMQRGIFFAGILYAVCGVLNAYAASSVRNLGVGNTYSSASVAADAAASNASSTTTGANLRGGSVRVTAGTSQTGTATNVNNSTRVITTPRLSLGQYLGGGTSISGGSSIRPQTPSAGTSGSGGGSLEPGTAAGIREEIDKLREELYTETDALREADKNLEEEKQNNLVPVEGGYIILDDRTNEISIDIENLKDAIGSVIGKDGREIELGIQGEYLAWRYVGDDAWTALIAIADITGPQGPQGEMGPQGPQGEPGDPADVDLSGYPTFDEMNAAIAGAVAGIADLYATKEYVDTTVSDATAGLATNKDLVRGLAGKVEANAAIVGGTGTKITYDEKGLVTGSANLEVADLPDSIPTSKIDGLDSALAEKANASDVYTKTETYNKQEVDDKIQEVVTGDIGDALQNYATKEYVDTGLAGKVNVSDLDNYATKEEVELKADKAVVSALEAQVGVVQGMAEDAGVVAANAANTASAAQTIANEAKSALDSKADKATTLAGYGITDAYTKTEVDEKLSGLEAGDLTEIENQLNQKADITYVDEQLAGKVNSEDLGALATKNQITNEDVADGAGIVREKLSQDVQESLEKADNAVSMVGAGSNMVLGTDAAGQKVWYEIAL